MITISGKQYEPFIEWLNRNYPTGEDVRLICLVGYPVVMVPELGESDDAYGGFACYMEMEGKHVIWVADIQAFAEALGEELAPNEDLVMIANEYIHYLMHVQGCSQDEEEVERRAREIVQEYLRSLDERAMA